MKKQRLAVLIGTGSRLPAIYEYTKTPDCPVEIAVVVSYKKDSPKISWMQDLGVPAFYHRWIDYKKAGKSKEEFNRDLAELLKKYNADFVLGVGWDIIWTQEFLESFSGAVLNAHPFPLPDTPVETIIYENQIVPVLRGMNAFRRAYEGHLPVTGACVHLATETVDVGPVIKRVYLPINYRESWEVLEQKHLQMENQLLVEVIDAFAKGEVDVINNLAAIKKDSKKHWENEKKKLLVIGSGGREHAIVWKLAQSKNVEKIYCAPGNAGTSELAENVSIKATDITSLLSFVKEKHIDLTLVGPDDPLSLGIVDIFQENGMRIFGPTKQAAKLEWSKAWAAEFMKKYEIPQPKSEIFHDPQKAIEYVQKLEGKCVVKADGLALGKGVIICNSFKEAKEAIKRMMMDKEFGKAGETIVIQERLEGYEVSVMAFCDGKVAIPIVPAQDHKRVFDGNLGPNTGGMGTFAPTAHIPARVLKKIHRLLTLAVEGMREDGLPYVGILYGGFMVVDQEPYVLEFNSRFGDPETQVQLPLLEGDLLQIMEACIDGTLHKDMIKIKNEASVCVVLASGGYPGKYATGFPIQGLEKIEKRGDLITFHAGTMRNHASIITSGGRVLGLTAIAKTIDEARKKVYEVIGEKIYFNDMHYRKDIGIKP